LTICDKLTLFALTGYW